MLFSNKKEEVLDIQLTPHGRHLLSIGKLQPVYYSFHDSNILYDGRYAGISELTKEIEDRIQHNTPQSKTLNSIASRSKKINQLYYATLDDPTSHASEEKIRASRLLNKAREDAERNADDKTFLVTHPIGSSSPTTDLAPSWSIKVLNGEISGSIPHLTSSFQTLKIPQIDIEVIYKTAIGESGTPLDTGLNSHMNPDPALSSRVFKDGTYVAIDPDHLLLEVLEENTEYTNTNFEVEVFEVGKETSPPAGGGLTGDKTTRERLVPLFFRKPVENIVNNVLLDDSEVSKPLSVPDSPYMVDHFFNVLVDEEIDLADLCEAKQTFDEKSLFVNLDVVCPPDGVTPSRYSVYTGPEPLEPCPTPQEGVDCNDEG